MKSRALWRVLVPLVLIFLGLMLLCNNLGIVPGLWDFIWRLWPLLLIGLGLAVLLGWRVGWPWRTAESMPFNEPLGEVHTATLELSGRVGQLEATAASPNSQDLLGGTIAADSQAVVEVTGNAASLRFRRPLGRSWWPFLGTPPRWSLFLHPRVSWTLRIASGVGETNLDLSDLRVPSLHLEGRVGSAQVHLPQRDHTSLTVGEHLGDLTLRVPSGVAARIHRPRGSLGTWRVDTARFPQRGDVYESPGYEQAMDRVEVKLGSSLGDLRVV